MSETVFDLIVLGAGPGGYVAALAAARAGMKVAVVEKQTVGGTCLGRGCIPTKTMLHTAGIYQSAKEGGPIGIVSDGLSVDMNALQDYKNETVQTLSDGIKGQFKKAKVSLFTGSGTILSTGEEKQVEVNGEILRAGRLLIATGSEPSKLPVPGIDLPGVLTSDELLDNRQSLRSLTIIGGGVIGMEFACLYAALGASVTVIEALDRILAGLDKEFGQNLKMILKGQGVTIHTAAMLKEIREDVSGENAAEPLVCLFEEKGQLQEARSEKVLVAVGRRSFTEGLFDASLAEESLPKMERGKILVDDHFETSVPGVFAIGDVIPGIQLAHVASAQGENAVCYMLGKEPAIDISVVPSCVYTEPEIASVGLTLQQAKDQGMDAQQLRYVMSANGKTVLTRQPRGFMRLVAEKGSGRILGAQLMCARATDMIGEFASAIVNGYRAQDMAKAIRPHPTFNEAVAEMLREFSAE
ncbi:MAG: dihydrolipoyl dehydrogenase [Firmicutes bacterium]|nr:dihydrolipoyl dehydrogenase [Bacillota bacterium]